MSDYIVGIDLGTTHCALAYSPIARPSVRVFDIPQLVSPGEVAARPLLPSFLYLAASDELTEAQRSLPWGAPDIVVGEAARRLGARSPNRLVASSKSWICHGGVNRRSPILPWSAPDDARHVSPFEASSHLLAHLRAAWDHAHPDAPLADQEVVVTVPASFDEVARELTVEAARLAGLPRLRLIEEPQAALYDFLGTHHDDLVEILGDACLALVVDVGGGTTDLTLVRVGAGEGAPEIERIAVGGHLMLGGDNMDAAVAHYAAREAGVDGKLDPTEWSALTAAACRAKETLLGEDPPDQAVVSIQRRGSRLIGGTKSQTIRREDLWSLLVDGFVPRTGPAEVPERRGRAGLTQLGLPYEADPAIAKHVCAFLRRHVAAATEAGAEVIDGLPRPDLLLLNGGVFAAPVLADRFTAVVGSWFDAPPRLLPHTSLDKAVARGAVRFGLAGHGHGLVIGGGAARGYYVGVDDADGTRRALCIAPRGMEDGAKLSVRDRVFELLLGRRVVFELFTSTADRGDEAGALVDIDDDLEALPPITTAFASRSKLWRAASSAGVQVTLASELTDTGILELSLVTVELPPHRWRLAFDLGAEAEVVEEPEAVAAEGPVRLGAAPEGFSEAVQALRRVFGTGRGGRSPQDARGVRVEVEAAIGPRGQWSAAVCRHVLDACLEHVERRGRTPEHEVAWLRLTGYCARPGLGVEGDAGRVDALWGLGGLVNPTHKAAWGEWWILWRRVASGLDRARQVALFDDARRWLDPSGRPPSGPAMSGHREMMRMVAALDRVDGERKALAGRWCLERFKKLGSWWAIGRLGSRRPLGGGEVVAPAVAGKWLERVLGEDWSRADGAMFAAVLIARKAGNVGVDLDDGLRRKVVARLQKEGASPHWIELVREGAALSDGDAGQIYGDALPSGLRLAE